MLSEHYEALYASSLSKISRGGSEIDPLISSDGDARQGITLIARPNEAVLSEIDKFCNRLAEVEPRQYFYSTPQVHITVMSIISCYNGFDLTRISVDRYVDVVNDCIDGLNQFEVEFRGLTMSPSCLMVRGFPSDNTLNTIRDRLRSSFKNSDLEQSIDKRYSIQTAHSTIFRLCRPLSDIKGYLHLIEEYKDHSFGSFCVDKMELVCNDWYHKSSKVSDLHTFLL